MEQVSKGEREGGFPWRRGGPLSLLAGLRTNLIFFDLLHPCGVFITILGNSFICGQVSHEYLQMRGSQMPSSTCSKTQSEQQI